jgi:hypothetical protein
VERTLREKLRGEVLSSYWEDLAPHQARGALLMLSPDVDLLDAAEAMAQDDNARVGRWLETGAMRRVGAAEAERLGTESEALGEESELRFQFVVVQPWVLAQALI